VLCLSKKQFSTKQGKETNCDDLLWVCVGDVFICGVYLPPFSSPFSRHNENLMKTLQEDILFFQQKGKTIVLTDSNCWIGEQPSTVEGGEERVVFPRKNCQKKTQKQGKWFVENMNSVNMLLMNGIKNETQNTYEHQTLESKSVIDFVIVDEKTLEKTTDIEYNDFRLELNTDHVMLSVKTEVKIEQHEKPP
jgi:hypothetical protein